MEYICPKSGRDFSNAEGLRDCMKSCESKGICRYDKKATKTRNMKSDKQWLKTLQFAFGVNRKFTSKWNYKDARCSECGSDSFYTKPNTNQARCSNCEAVFEISKNPHHLNMLYKYMVLKSLH